MQAAEKLFAGRRFHEITVGDIAREAHVGKGTIYQYFEDKDHLFFQVATSGFDEMCELLHRKVPEDAPFVEQLVSACNEISGFFERRRQLFRMVQTENARMPWCRGEMRQRWMAQRERLAAALAAIISKGVAEGTVRSDYPVDVLAISLLGLLRTRALELKETPPAFRTCEAIMELFLHGAARPHEGGPGREED
jgi:AcrR family transcriptional regulator